MTSRLLAAAILLCCVLAVQAGGGWISAWKERMDDPAASREQVQEALDLVRQHGPGTLRHGRTLDRLAELNLREGDLQAAESLYLRSIPMLRQRLGPDQPRLATSWHNLGVVYLRAGRNEDAEQPAREALRIWSAAFGPDHPETARAYRSLAVLMRRQGDHGEADRLEALAARHLREPEAAPGP